MKMALAGSSVAHDLAGSAEAALELLQIEHLPLCAPSTQPNQAMPATDEHRDQRGPARPASPSRQAIHTESRDGQNGERRQCGQQESQVPPLRKGTVQQVDCPPSPR